MNTNNTGRDNATPLFQLGQVVATPNALDALDRAAINGMELIRRHQHGDWGNVPPSDAEENDLSVTNGWRILPTW